MTYKNILQKGAFVALMTGTLVMTVSCNDDDVSPVLEERVLVKEINLEVTPELPLLIGTDTLIKYTVGPDKAFNKELVWKSTVPDVATVDAEGRITAISAGNTVISARPAVGYSTTSTINVKVVNEIIHITDINLTNEDLEVFVTSTLPLTWQTTPADPTYPGLIWKSLTPDKATVNEKGEVKGIAEGKARIQVTATDDKHFTKEFEIKVKPIIYIESMEFVKETDKLALGETYTPQMNVTPIDATLSYITWESSKPDVVEIDEKGRFVAKAYGNAVITALADYGDGKPVKATMSVNVSEGLMNDQFTVENIWQPFGNFTHREFEWMENDGVLRIFPGEDKTYKAVRICRNGGFGFNVTNYPILAFKMKFPENVFEASTSIEWYLDIWGGSGITVAGKYGEDTDKGKNAMTVVDCGEYKVFYADFTKKFLGKNQQYMPTSLTKYDTVELQFWKIWYEANETGSIYVDWIKTFESEQELKDLIKNESGKQ